LLVFLFLELCFVVVCCCRRCHCVCCRPCAWQGRVGVDVDVGVGVGVIGIVRSSVSLCQSHSRRVCLSLYTQAKLSRLL
jgi:hypothetical protein